MATPPGTTMSLRADELLMSMQRSYMELPEGPVGIGDTFEGGEMIMPVPGFGKLRSSVSYEITGISDDEREVLLGMAGDFTIEPMKGGPEEPGLDSGGVKGWMLFDLDLGNARHASMEMEMDIEGEMGGVSIGLKQETKIICYIED